MATHDENRFRPRPGIPKRTGRDGGERFVSKVVRQVSRASQGRSGTRLTKGATRFGRGRVAAGLAPSSPSPRSRRVVIKSRFVMIRKGSGAAAQHLRYIARDGVTREGESGRAYGAETDQADTRAFEARGQGDRHQFRFIVSPEDAEELAELRDFTRALMRRMSVDLESRLDWVAVDHWDTDNPHTHIVLRGRADNGQDLVIAPDYMGHGLRYRASQIVTDWLGPRTERDIQQSVQREVMQERFTSLDRSLTRQAVLEVVDAGTWRGDAAYQRMLRARLQHLCGLGLALQLEPNRWRLDGQLEPTLRGLGERGDIIRSLHRAMRGERRAWAIHPGEDMRAPIVGKIIAKGLADELRDTGYLIVDGVDGRAHYVRLPPNVEMADYPTGGVVDIRPPLPSAADRAIASVARDGVYRTAEHHALIQGRGGDPERSVPSHVRRLEALRRAGLVERVADGIWKIPADLPEQGRAFDMQRTGGLTVALQSHAPLERLIQAPGATWLDTQLIAGGQDLASAGFGAQARQALAQRMDYLEQAGLATRQGQRVVLARNLLDTLRTRELGAVAKTLQGATGLAYEPLGQNGRISGVYRRALMLSSGRYALLDNGRSFSLVPWKPVIEQRLGQMLSATARGGRVTWTFGRQRGLGA